FEDCLRQCISSSSSRCASCSKTKCVRQDCSSGCQRKSYIVSLSRVLVLPFGFSEKLRPNVYQFCAKRTRSCRVKWRRLIGITKSCSHLLSCFRCNRLA